MIPYSDYKVGSENTVQPEPAPEPRTRYNNHVSSHGNYYHEQHKDTSRKNMRNQDNRDNSKRDNMLYNRDAAKHDRWARDMPWNYERDTTWPELPVPERETAWNWKCENKTSSRLHTTSNPNKPGENVQTNNMKDILTRFMSELAANDWTLK